MLYFSVSKDISESAKERRNTQITENAVAAHSKNDILDRADGNCD